MILFSRVIQHWLLLLLLECLAPTVSSVPLADYVANVSTRVLLAAVVGQFSDVRLEMLRITMQTGRFHLGSGTDVLVAAHSSWQGVEKSRSGLSFATHSVVVPDDLFFETNTTAGLSADVQAARNRFRLLQLAPQAMQYDIVLLLDIDAVVLSDVLELTGTVQPDTLYVALDGHAQLHAGQFVFRPSPLMLQTFQEVYTAGAPNATADGETPQSEAHTLRAAFQRNAKVSYRLTHLIAMTTDVCEGDAVAEYAVVHCASLAAMHKAQQRAWRRFRVEHHPILSRIHRAATANAISAYKKKGNKGNPFWGMGHVGEVPFEVLSYAEAVRQSGIRKVCEVGFNAGHSAAIALFSNPDATVTSFDMGTLAWSAASVGFLHHTFPDLDRLTYIKGNSHHSLPHYAQLVHQGNATPCDILLVDGDHSYDGAKADFRDGRLVSAPRGFLFADDATLSFPGVKVAWQELVDQGHLETLYCTVDPVLVGGCQKGWCVGRYRP
eukprot:EG_transcript_7527